MKAVTLYDDTYTGPRFRYGYRNRPCGIGNQPQGFILGSYKPYNNAFNKVRWGTIDYPFELSKQDVLDFELVFIGEV